MSFNVIFYFSIIVVLGLGLLLFFPITQKFYNRFKKKSILSNSLTVLLSVVVWFLFMYFLVVLSVIILTAIYVVGGIE